MESGMEGKDDSKSHIQGITNSQPKREGEYNRLVAKALKLIFDTFFFFF